MPSNDKIANLEFPLGGIDVTTEFQEQKPGTTPEAINVRGFDPIARRARGGSRPGISHYPPDAVPANTSLNMNIQHLNVIVDPHASALPQNFEVPGPDWIPDPLNPPTFVPPGGWGVPGGGAFFGGLAELEGVGTMAAEGEEGTGVTNRNWTITIDYAVGFGGLELDPGTSPGSVCDNGTDTLAFAGDNYTFSQLSTKEAIHAILVAQSYVGAETTPSQVIDSVTLTDNGPC